MPAEPTQHARYVATLVSIVASSIVGGGGAAIPAAWATWGLLKKRAEAAGRAGVEVVEEQSAVVRSLIRLSSMLRLFEDTLWLGNIREDLGSSAIVGKSLLQEDAVDAGTLTTEPVAHIDQIFIAPPPPPSTLAGDIAVDEEPSAGYPPPVEPPSNTKPPRYDRPLSVRCADSLPPMGEYKTRIFRDGLEGHPVRVVPDAFKDLSFDAKIVYASSYGENVWSRTLIYSNGDEAAVGPDNQPLYNTAGLKLDSVGNVVNYFGIPVKDLETSGFSKSASWKDQQAKLEIIKKAISQTPRSFKADLVEQERIKSEQERDRYKKNQARIRKMEEGREKLQKLREDKQRAEATYTTDDKAKEEASQEERFRKLREDRQQAQAKAAAEKKAKEESDRERERLQMLKKDRQQVQDAAEKRGKSEADLKKEEAVRKIKEPYSYRRAKEEARQKIKERGDRRAQREAGRKAREENDRKAKEEADRRAKEESDRRAKEEADRNANEEADRKAREKADEKAKEEAGRKAEEEALEHDEPNAAKWKHKSLTIPPNAINDSDDPNVGKWNTHSTPLAV